MVGPVGLSFYSRLHINSLGGFNIKHLMSYEKICEGGILIAAAGDK